MAYIRSYDTTQKRKGKTVKRYEVGLAGAPTRCIRPVDRRLALAAGKLPNPRAAEARRDELDAAKHTSGTGVLADAKKAGELPFGYYARAWLDAQGLKVAQGKLKQRTVGLPTFERRDIWERPYSRTAGGCTDV